MGNSSAPVSTLHQHVVEELNRHLFFIAIQRVFKDNNMGDSKARQIMGVIGGGSEIPRPEVVDAHPSTRKQTPLFLDGPLRDQIRALSASYWEPRELMMPALAIQIRDRAVVCALANDHVHVPMPPQYQRHLHSELGNSASYKYVVLWCALRLYCHTFGARGALPAPAEFIAQQPDLAAWVARIKSKKGTVVDFEVDLD